MKNARKILILPLAALLTALLATACAAQTVERDPSETETWLELSARAKLARGTSLTFTQNLRWNDVFGHSALIAPELSMRQRLKSWWRVEGGYRYQRDRDNDDVFQNRHRIFANTRFRARTSDADYELRVQWQEEFRHELDDGTPRRHVLRTRGKVKLRNLENVAPYGSLELFHRVDGNDADTEAGTLTKLRFALGAEWGSGPVEYDARYMLVVPEEDETAALRHVLCFGVRFDTPW